jgi:thiamine biosynthesis protein ThiC
MIISRMAAISMDIEKNIEWTASQERQLANARAIALQNRRSKLRIKLESRLALLNQQLPRASEEEPHNALALVPSG